MSWFREAGATWKRRASVSVDNTAGGAGAVDIEFTIPVTFETFWTEIDASGNELRIVDADGVTKLPYNVTGFNKTTRAGTFQVDGYVAPGAGMLQLFVYWNATGAATGAVAVTITVPKTGYVQDCGPTRDMVRATPPRAGDLRPARKLQKNSDETRRVTFDVGPMLQARRLASQSRYECDEIDYVSYVVTTAGASQAAMVDATKTRLYGGRFVVLLLKAGTDGTDYTVTPTIRTTEGDVLTPRAWLQVKDQDEA